MWSLDRPDSDVVYVEASVASLPRVQPMILREVEVVKRLLRTTLCFTGVYTFQERVIWLEVTDSAIPLTLRFSRVSRSYRLRTCPGRMCGLRRLDPRSDRPA